jgi:hypothetical protein
VVGAEVCAAGEGQSENLNEKEPSKKQIPLSEKTVRTSVEVHATLQSEAAVGAPRLRRQAPFTMIMKFCPNYRCAAYGRVVYTQSTRCVFCKWDLKPPRMKSETVEEESESDQGWTPTDAPVASERRMQPRRTALRHTA